MSTIPTTVTQEQFAQYISPYLRKAKRGFVCSIPLYKVFHDMLYFLHTGCQWNQLPMESQRDHPDKLERGHSCPWGSKPHAL
jgi:hypothetical protein